MGYKSSEFVTMNKKSNLNLENRAEELAVKIAELLISRKITPTNLAQCLVRTNPDLFDIWELIDQLVDTILNANEQLSRNTVMQKIIYGDIATAIHKPGMASISHLEAIVRQSIHELLTYAAYSTITLPIIDLEIGQDQFEFGKIILLPVTEEFKKSALWEKVDSYFEGRSSRRFLSIAKIDVPGDTIISIHHALERVTNLLVLLRGIGLQIVFEENFEVSQFGLLNEFPIWRNHFVKRETLKENYRFDYSWDEFTLTGKAYRPCNLHDDILQNVDPGSLKSLEEIFISEGKNEMQRKLLRGFQWIGEATKPDKLESKVVKLVFGLEAIIGGEPSEASLSTRGITASIAERAAFLVSENCEERDQVDQDIRNVYNLRSAIVHGDDFELNTKDLIAYTKLIREVAWSLLINLDQFNNINQLQNWVKKMRYL
jgi:hypothetical protein